MIAESEQVSTKPKLNRTQLCVKLSTKQHKQFSFRDLSQDRDCIGRRKRRGMKRAPNTNYCQHDFHFSLNFLADSGEALSCHNRAFSVLFTLPRQAECVALGSILLLQQVCCEENEFKILMSQFRRENIQKLLIFHFRSQVFTSAPSFKCF